MCSSEWLEWPLRSWEQLARPVEREDEVVAQTEMVEFWTSKAPVPHKWKGWPSHSSKIVTREVPASQLALNFYTNPYSSSIRVRLQGVGVKTAQVQDRDLDLGCPALHLAFPSLRVLEVSGTKPGPERNFSVPKHPWRLSNVQFTQAGDECADVPVISRLPCLMRRSRGETNIRPHLA